MASSSPVQPVTPFLKASCGRLDRVRKHGGAQRCAGPPGLYRRPDPREQFGQPCAAKFLPPLREHLSVEQRTPACPPGILTSLGGRQRRIDVRPKLIERPDAVVELVVREADVVQMNAVHRVTRGNVTDDLRDVVHRTLVNGREEYTLNAIAVAFRVFRQALQVLGIARTHTCQIRRKRSRHHEPLGMRVNEVTTRRRRNRIGYQVDVHPGVHFQSCAMRVGQNQLQRVERRRRPP